MRNFKMEVLLKVGCLPYAVGNRLSIPLIKMDVKKMVMMILNTNNLLRNVFKIGTKIGTKNCFTNRIQLCTDNL